MNPELITILAAIFGVGIGLAGLMLTGHRTLGVRMDRIEGRMDRIESAIHALGERVARLEGAFPFIARPATEPNERPH